MFHFKSTPVETMRLKNMKMKTHSWETVSKKWLKVGKWHRSYISTLVFNKCGTLNHEHVMCILYNFEQGCLNFPWQWLVVVPEVVLWQHGGENKIARYMGPTWGPSGADRTQAGPMLAPWTLLSGMLYQFYACFGAGVITQYSHFGLKRIFV